MNFLRARRPLPACLGAALLVLSLAACTAAGEEPAAAPIEEIIAADPGMSQLAVTDSRDLVDALDRAPLDNRPQFIASVRAEEVLLDVAGEQGSLPLPDDEFYVSIAPYLESTHECTYHSLTTCVGEMQQEPMHVTVTDDSGQTVLEEDLETFDNGFFGLWLPRDMQGSITITHESGSVEAPISTGPDDPTCVTDLRLTSTGD